MDAGDIEIKVEPLSRYENWGEGSRWGGRGQYGKLGRYFCTSYYAK